MRSLARRLLRSVQWYPDIKDARIYDVYRRLRFPRSWQRLAREIDLARQFTLNASAPVIFDVGANRGDRAAVYRRVAHRVLCVEPDRLSQQRLRLRFRHWPNVIVVAKAVGSSSGNGWLHVHQAGSAINTLNANWRMALEKGANGRFAPQTFTGGYEVEVTSLDELIAAYGSPCYLKLDIEGSEANALRGLSYPVPFVSFEANLPELLHGTLQCLQLLADLSPAVQFLFAREDGLAGGSSDFLDPAAAARFLHSAPQRFFEILASLQPDEAHLARIRALINAAS